MASGLKKKTSQQRIATKVAVGALFSIFYSYQFGSSRHLHFFFDNVSFSISPPRSPSLDLSSLTGEEISTSDESLGLAVVHCRESNMTYLNQVPRGWSPFRVYETCGENSHPNASMPFKNAGSEECTAYLDFVISNYDNLPNVSIFIQADALRGYQAREGRDVTQAHTPFGSISEMGNHTQRALTSNSSSGFVHFGPPIPYSVKIRYHDPYLEYYLNETWNDMGLSSNNETVVTTRPGACFAVRKERILSRKKEIYKMIQSKILSSNADVARRRCCTLERSWHVLFGEPNILPETSSMDHLYKNITWKIW